MASTLPEDRVDREFLEHLKELTKTMRHAVVLLEHLTKGVAGPKSKSRKTPQVKGRLPDLAKVKVVGGDGLAAEVTGETGVILSGDADHPAGWVYTVLIDSTKETYVLPHRSLQFEQKVARETDLYTNTVMAVSVDATGAGHSARRNQRR